MITHNQADFVKDLANKKITVTRHFDAPVEQVWKAWTESELLDQWWAPKPFKAETKLMDFKVGGYWLYAMVGPDVKHWCRVDFKAITPNKSFEAEDMFCDENGNKNESFPSMDWKNEFFPEADGTKVVIQINFASQADLETIVQMGFEEGFAAGLRNLDELLAQAVILPRNSK